LSLKREIAEGFSRLVGKQTNGHGLRKRKAIRCQPEN